MQIPTVLLVASSLLVLCACVLTKEDEASNREGKFLWILKQDDEKHRYSEENHYDWQYEMSRKCDQATCDSLVKTVAEQAEEIEENAKYITQLLMRVGIIERLIDPCNKLLGQSDYHREMRSLGFINSTLGEIERPGSVSNRVARVLQPNSGNAQIAIGEDEFENLMEDFFDKIHDLVDKDRDDMCISQIASPCCFG